MTDLVRIGIKPGGTPLGLQAIAVPARSTVEEIALRYYGSLDGLVAWLRVPGSENAYRELPREHWRHVRVKSDDAIAFTFRMHGGGSKSIFVAVAAIALAVIAPYAGAAIAGSLVTAGLIGASSAAIVGGFVSAGIIVGGTLLLQKLFPPNLDVGALAAADDLGGSAFEDVSSDANVLARSGFLPWVFGPRRIAPPDIIEPRTFMKAGAQTIDRAVALYGEHSIENVWVDGTPIDSIPSISSDIKDGAEDSGTYGLIEQISATTAVQETLSTFALDESTNLEDQIAPINSEPRWHSFSTPDHPDLSEIAFLLRIDGFVTQTSTTEVQRVPLRIRMRKRGEATWINLPEIHVIGRDPSVLLRTIRFRWDEVFGGTDIGGEAAFEFWREVPAVTAYALSDESEGATQWEANAYFSNGSGYQDVRLITGKRSGIEVVLATATFPKGAYEFQVMRGLATALGTLGSDYTISSVVESLFVSKRDGDSWVVPVAQGGFLSQFSIPQATGIADRWPTEWPKTAKVEIRSRGQSVRNITLEANTAVLDWDEGSPGAWATATTSDNPATLYRHLLYEYLSFYGIDTSLIDDETMVAWRQECVDRGYKCSAVFAGETVLEALAAIAAAGFARPTFGWKFSVDYFRDRSADTPVQLFSLRNTESIEFSITAPQRPVGYRARFQNKEMDWKDDELEVTIGNYADVNNWEQVTYSSIDDPELIRRRATFDLLQVTERRRTWRVQCPIEGVLCAPGDLVSLVTDLFDDRSQGARIRQAIDESTLVIDQMIPGADTVDFGESPGPTVNQLFTAGLRSIVFISTPAGIVQRTITGVSGNVITLDSPLAATTDLRGSPVNITTLSNAEHRCFVLDVTPSGEEMASLTLVDEAPQIWDEMERLFG